MKRHSTAGLRILLLLGIRVWAADAAAPVAPVIIPCAEARIRRDGKIQQDGAFSFWTGGVIGDAFIAEAESTVRLTVLAHGRVVGGEGPQVAVEIEPAGGRMREAARFEVKSREYYEYAVAFPVSPGYFTLTLRHTNRLGGPEPEGLRHLLLKSFGMDGARRADCSPAEWAFFVAPGAVGILDKANGSGARIVETRALRVAVNAQRPLWWSVEARASRLRLDGIHPVFDLGGLSVNLAEFETSFQERVLSDHALGPVREVAMHCRKVGALDISYRLLICEEAPEVVAQVDFENLTGRPLVVNRVAVMVIPRVSVGDDLARWSALTDGDANNNPCRLVTAPELKGPLEGWWYLALKDQDTGHCALFGNITNNKGQGRFLLSPTDGGRIRIAAYNDYESIVISPGARVTGEWTALSLGRGGRQALERFGGLIARAHGVDLLRQRPINPYDPARAGLFGSWNPYGSGVMRGFPYKHDATGGRKPYEDAEWVAANQKRLVSLGLREFGYGASRENIVKNAGKPLARRYGAPDFWFPEAEQISREHPEFYVDRRIDFSNPAVVDFERARVARAFAGAGNAVVRYGWDFTNVWRRLPGQHDPFQTGAETYRTAMGLWRDAASRCSPGAYGMVWMNRIGINYGLVDVIHIGHDSDQGYYGEGCTFTGGLVRQISGRYYYNGRLWWNNPDTFHVFVGGLYSYQQAKTHASFCSIAGNLVHLGEPFVDEQIPEDRLEIIRRVCPTTGDVASAVDVFENSPARLWNLPIRRAFGQWNIAGLFNVDFDHNGKPITQAVTFEDLDLSKDKEYLVYEFWSRRFMGVIKGGFTRTLAAPDCEVYAIVEEADRPVLVSTSRHVRQMAFDIRQLKWDATARELRGVSLVVKDDPYQLRVFVPDGTRFSGADAQGLPVKASLEGALLTIDFTARESGEVRWRVGF